MSTQFDARAFSRRSMLALHGIKTEADIAPRPTSIAAPPVSAIDSVARSRADMIAQVRRAGMTPNI